MRVQRQDREPQVGQRGHLLRDPRRRGTDDGDDDVASRGVRHGVGGRVRRELPGGHCGDERGRAHEQGVPQHRGGSHDGVEVGVGLRVTDGCGAGGFDRGQRCAETRGVAHDLHRDEDVVETGQRVGDRRGSRTLLRIPEVRGGQRGAVDQRDAAHDGSPRHRQGGGHDDRGVERRRQASTSAARLPRRSESTFLTTRVVGDASRAARHTGPRGRPPRRVRRAGCRVEDDDPRALVAVVRDLEVVPRKMHPDARCAQEKVAADSAAPERSSATTSRSSTVTSFGQSRNLYVQQHL